MSNQDTTIKILTADEISNMRAEISRLPEWERIKPCKTQWDVHRIVATLEYLQAQIALNNPSHPPISNTETGKQKRVTTPPPPQDSNRAAYPAYPAYTPPLHSMTEAERKQIRAYLRRGSFQEAANDCNVSRYTVSRTWHRWRVSLCAAMHL